MLIFGSLARLVGQAITDLIVAVTITIVIVVVWETSGLFRIMGQLEVSMLFSIALPVCLFWKPQKGGQK